MNLFPLIFVLLGLLSQALAATYYTLLFTLASAGSQYGITSFDSTMIVPPTSSGSGSHSAWPGLEPESEAFVYQNVLIDSGAQWYFFTEYCCDPSNYDYPPQAVSPGNSIVSSFNLDTASGEWINTWSQVGISAGAVSTNSFPTEGILSQAVFAVELQNGATWDFGDVIWLDITIVANTTATSWCTSYEIFGGFTTTISTPVATVSGSSSTCYIASLVFHAPRV